MGCRVKWKDLERERPESEGKEEQKKVRKITCPKFGKTNFDVPRLNYFDPRLFP
jgi:hypothetical protein